jgi:hypothetical protein
VCNSFKIFQQQWLKYLPTFGGKSDQFMYRNLNEPNNWIQHLPIHGGKSDQYVDRNLNNPNNWIQHLPTIGEKNYQLPQKYSLTVG